MKGKLAILLGLVLLAPLLVRADFNIKVNPVKSVVNVYSESAENAEFEVTIENLLTTQDKFTLSFSKDLSWIIRTKDLSDYFTGIDIPALQQKTTTMTVAPGKLWPAGTYNIVVGIRSEATGIEKQASLPITVQVPTASDVIKLSIELPEKIDPRTGGEMLITVESKIPLKRSGLKVVVNDSLGLINFEKEISVDSLSKANIKIPITMSPLQNPRDDYVRISLYDEDENLLKEEQRVFSITGYSVLSESESTNNEFLKKTTTITISNSGNAPGTKIVVRKVGFFQNLFLRTTPKANWVRVDGKRLIGWKVDVPPNSQKTVTMRTSYRGLVLVIIIIAALVFAYYYFKPPVEIKKSASIVRQNEGGIAELKVMLSIKNRGGRVVRNIRLVDAVPDIADVEDNFQAGTIKPENITKSISSGTLIRWNIERMEPYDERLISYKINSKLAIVGNFRLKPAVARYVINEKEYKAVSNPVWIKAVNEEKE